MKNFLYGRLAKLGYKIENKNKRKSEMLGKLSGFDVKDNISLLLRQYQSVTRLQAVYPELAISDKDVGLLFSFAGLQFYVESGEEIFILSEVFYEKDYRFISDEKAVLIDIGANIGISSLFFSQLPNLTKIYAFEPVEDTFKQAVYNIGINNLADKITIENIGLAKDDRTEIFMFNKSIKGNTGVRGTKSESYANVSKTEEREVKFKDSLVVFEKIIAENPGHKIIVKMDCEGAEYEIMARLQTGNMLAKIDAMLIEWHDKGPEEIEAHLSKSGFFIFSRQLEINSGMIYAKKQQ